MKDRGGIKIAWHTASRVVLLLGGLALVLPLCERWVIERQHFRTDLLDTTQDLRTKIVMFHLRFEKAVMVGTNDWTEPLAELDGALDLEEVLVNGGTAQAGAVLHPMTDPNLKERFEAIRSRLLTLRTVAEECLQAPPGGYFGSPAEAQTHTLLAGALEDFQVIEAHTVRQVARDHEVAWRLFQGEMAFWALTVGAATVFLRSRESIRRRAEEALQIAHAELEQRVVERTAELTAANRRLEGEIAVRQTTEDSLRLSETEYRRLSSQFQTLLKAIPDSIALVSSDLRVVWSNQAASPDGAGRCGAGAHCLALPDGAVAPSADCPALRSFRTERTEHSQVSRPDGCIWECRAFPMPNEDGRVENVIAIGTDVTEKLMLQAESLRAAHLASIGELAAGVAHEINNPINGIINYARIIANQVPSESQESDVANRIVKEGRRIAGIVASLLTFARDSKGERAVVRLEGILNDSLTLTETQVKKEGIRLRMDLPPGLPGVVANRQQIQQVFMNVIGNARYALNRKYVAASEDKTLDIAGEAVATPQGTCIRITFHDRGTGIPAGIMDKIMDPFFTTKPTGRGIGLGLSISRSIVEEHGGRLAVESVEGEFTKVSIDLPAGAAHA